MSREAIAIDHHNVDGIRAVGDAFAQDLVAFIAHGREDGVDDFIMGKVAACDALFLTRQ